MRIASATLSATWRKVFSTSRRSTTVMFGNAPTAAPMNRERSTGSSGPFTKPAQVRGNSRRLSGWKRKVKPPFRAFRHSTSRNEVIRASRVSPRMRNRTVSPTRRPCSRHNSISAETSTPSAGRSPQNSPAKRVSLSSRNDRELTVYSRPIPPRRTARRSGKETSGPKTASIRAWSTGSRVTDSAPPRRAFASTASRWSDWMSRKKTSGAPASSWKANSRRRLRSIAVVASTRKTPTPSATSVSRTEAAPRRTVRAAWRTGKVRAAASGPRARSSRPARNHSVPATSAKPAVTASVTRKDPDCQPASPRKSAPQAAATPTSIRRAREERSSSSRPPLRRRPSGRTRRSGSSGKNEASSAAAAPVSAPEAAAPAVSRTEASIPPMATGGMKKESAAAPTAMPKTPAAPASAATWRAAIRKIAREWTPRHLRVAAPARFWRVKAVTTLKTPTPPSTRITNPERLR